MRLYLMRHGRPEAKDKNPERPLTNQGKWEVERVACFLRNNGVTFEEAFHSGKTRARQTAEIMVSNLNPRLALTQREGLSPLDDVSDIAEYAGSAVKDLLIVGHLPHLGKLASLLIIGDESVPVVRFREGSVVCLEKDKERFWSIVWMLVPDIL